VFRIRWRLQTYWRTLLFLVVWAVAFAVLFGWFQRGVAGLAWTAASSFLVTCVLAAVAEEVFEDGIKTGLLRICGIGAGLTMLIAGSRLFVEEFRRNPFLVAVIWFCVPLLAVGLCITPDKLDDSFIGQLRLKRAILMVVAVTIPVFLMFSLGEEAFWRGMADDLAWLSDRNEGSVRWWLDDHSTLLNWALFVGFFGVPALTWFIATRAIKSATRQRKENQNHT